MGDAHIDKKAVDRGGVCVTVVLPTLNEAEALPKVVEELRSAGYDKILVVDGGSTDGTPERARELGVAAVRQMGEGKGMALRTALMYVDTPYVAVMDADYSYPPAELDKVVAHLRFYDLVLGARHGPMPFIYRLGNKALAWLFRLLFGADITDPLTGMYAARTDVLREAALEARNFDIEVDILAKAMANGARIAEVPVRYRRRIGRKKLTPWHGASIASKMVSLAYRLNPTLPLTIAGALLLIPGAALAGWVAYRFFYQGVPHYLLGTLAIILMLLGGVSAALLPLATALVRLQAAVARTARRHEAPTDCLPPIPPPPQPTPAEHQEQPTALERAAQGLIIAFTVLLATAAYYLGVGDVHTANGLAQWAYYALAGAVLALLADMVIHRGT
jgi:Glycosyltransferases involved in cell wall biogenesis